MHRFIARRARTVESRRIAQRAAAIAPEGRASKLLLPFAPVTEALEGRRYFTAIDPSHMTRFMAMGDSITAGSHFSGSYRLPLQEKLAAAGYQFDFVGSQTTFSDGMADPNHEGYSGERMINATAPAPGLDSMAAGDTITWDAPRQLYGAEIQNAINTYQPDVILLMIGVNDMTPIDSLTPANRATEYSMVLQQIFGLSPQIKVIAAPVLYKRDVVSDALMEDLRDRMRQVATSFRMMGHDIQWAPQAGGGPAGSIADTPLDVPDGIHPASADAYGRIANGFFNAIVEGTAGNTNTAPVVSSAGMVNVAGRGRRASACPSRTGRPSTGRRCGRIIGPLSARPGR